MKSVGLRILWKQERGSILPAEIRGSRLGPKERRAQAFRARGPDGRHAEAFRPKHEQVGGKIRQDRLSDSRKRVGEKINARAGFFTPPDEHFGAEADADAAEIAVAEAGRCQGPLL